MSSSFLFQFTPLREGRLQRSKRSASPSHFNSRPSARGDTPAELPNAPPAHFNSRPSARGDDVSPDSEGKLYIFQFTPLREGRRVLITSNECIERISIHAPPRGATDVQQEAAKPTAFQFTPLREGRRGTVYPPPRILISIHAPPRGATEKRAYKRTYARISIHAPPRGATKRAEATCRRPYISIHAPPRGATLFICQMICGDLFQFTPLREGRPGKNRRKHPSSKFQFTPLREGRQEEHDAFTAFLKAFQFTPLREGRPQKSIISG